MKKMPIPCFNDSRELKKILLLMRFTSCLLLATFLHVSANVRSQDSVKVDARLNVRVSVNTDPQQKLTVNVRQIGWQPFFDLLQKKSNYTFLYKDNILPRSDKFDVEVNNLTVPQILDNVLKSSRLTWQM